MQNRWIVQTIRLQLSKGYSAVRLPGSHLHPIIGAYLEGEDGEGEVLGLGHVVDLQQHRQGGGRRWRKRRIR